MIIICLWLEQSQCPMYPFEFEILQLANIFELEYLNNPPCPNYSAWSS